MVVPQINVLLPFHCKFRVFIISCCIVKNAQVNIFVIKALSVFGFISVEEMARGKGSHVAKVFSSFHMGTLNRSHLKPKPWYHQEATSEE